MDLNLLIQEKLRGLKTPQDFAQTISDLGFELIDSGRLDSDELVWEIARDQWKDFSSNFEEQVSEEFHKILESL